MRFDLCTLQQQANPEQLAAKQDEGGYIFNDVVFN